jgi:hypothetical protein
MKKYSLINILLILISVIFITSQFTGLNQNNLSSNSEFFAYSWIYGVRWGLGDFIFQPHSQLLYPIYSIVNTFFSISVGDMSSIIYKWHKVSFYWPIIIMLMSLIIFYTSSDSKNISIKILLFTLIFVVLFSFGLGGAVLSSMSYHVISIPIGLISLYFYNFYIREKSINRNKYYYSFLGLYAAVCVLAKPTFIAFAIPIYMIEISLMLRYKDRIIYNNLIKSIFVAILTYFLYLCWFYIQSKRLLFRK